TTNSVVPMPNPPSASANSAGRAVMPCGVRVVISVFALVLPPTRRVGPRASYGDHPARWCAICAPSVSVRAYNGARWHVGVAKFARVASAFLLLGRVLAEQIGADDATDDAAEQTLAYGGSIRVGALRRCVVQFLSRRGSQFGGWRDRWGWQRGPGGFLRVEPFGELGLLVADR